MEIIINEKQKANIQQAANLIKNSKQAIAFTGAGISVESGIPSFRGEGGLWNKYDSNILSLSRFYNNPATAWIKIKEIFYDFFGKAKPNAAHIALANLEKMGLIKAVITQNIDNLHQDAGSKNVIEFHGTCSSMVCIQCGKKYESKYVDLKQLPPHCSCGGVLKPNFVFFEEGIPSDAYKNSQNLIQKTDLIIIIGTTGEVMPAAYLPQIASNNGAKIIEINPQKSAFTNSITDVYIDLKAGDAMTEIMNNIN
ncbi:MAG: NAD-dependent deacylase [Bacteroidales bacterium]|nr:NAD-dependent deacylase [Bacteroidales bacterium]